VGQASSNGAMGQGQSQGAQAALGGAGQQSWQSMLGAPGQQPYSDPYAKIAGQQQQYGMQQAYGGPAAAAQQSQPYGAPGLQQPQLNPAMLQKLMSMGGFPGAPRPMQPPMPQAAQVRAGQPNGMNSALAYMNSMYGGQGGQP
jgi:hypothetical protein